MGLHPPQHRRNPRQHLAPRKPLAFDHIGAVGYSKDFGGLRTGDPCRLWRTVKALFDAMGVAGALTWPIAALAVVRSFGVKREFEDAVPRRDKRAKAYAAREDMCWWRVDSRGCECFDANDAVA